MAILENTSSSGRRLLELAKGIVEGSPQSSELRFRTRVGAVLAYKEGWVNPIS